MEVAPRKICLSFETPSFQDFFWGIVPKSMFLRLVRCWGLEHPLTNLAMRVGSSPRGGVNLCTLWLKIQACCA